jgi:hypothetical protein
VWEGPACREEFTARDDVSSPDQGVDAADQGVVATFDRYWSPPIASVTALTCPSCRKVTPPAGHVPLKPGPSTVNPSGPR